MSLLLKQIISHKNLDSAFSWLKNARKNYPSSSDIWEFRRNWEFAKTNIANALLNNKYKFSCIDKIVCHNKKSINMFCSSDALVLRAIAQVLNKHLNHKLTCCHLANKGGIKGAVRKINQNITEYKYIFKTDIKSYYDTINHYNLQKQLFSLIPCTDTVRLIYQSLNININNGGNYYLKKQGLIKGSPLSPILGAIYLKEIDQKLENSIGNCYIRYMDDFIYLTNKRSLLRKAIKSTYQILDKLYLSLAKDKTYIGRTYKVIDFLGYKIKPKKKLRLASKTISQAALNINLLYEQDRCKKSIRKYLKYFMSWAKGGIGRRLDNIGVINQLIESLSKAPFKKTQGKLKNVKIKRRKISCLKLKLEYLHC